MLALAKAAQFLLMLSVHCLITNVVAAKQTFARHLLQLSTYRCHYV